MLVLERVELRVTTEADGGQAMERFRQEPFDLVVLDVMLPSMDGFAVCRKIRCDSQVPILMLTARTDTTDVVTALDLGADDYVTKPFEVPELMARVRALLRRSAAKPANKVQVIHDLEIDAAAFTVRKHGAVLALTATEFRLLQALARRPGVPCAREALLERVWNYDYMGDSRLVDMAIKRLREKVEDDPAAPRRITTVRGVGYRLEPGQP